MFSQLLCLLVLPAALPDRRDLSLFTAVGLGLYWLFQLTEPGRRQSSAPRLVLDSWQRSTEMSSHHSSALGPRVGCVTSLYLSFHIWKMAITVPTSQKSCIKEMMCATNRLLATPCAVAHQAPLSMGFSRQEYWSGLPFPSPLSCTIQT